ncbi:probable F-box protein At3g61730 isoform X1 [Ricinus communis]|uniref:probable F-box protein At3g61730 isoform X1 n=1 Tax=Ricinus communis TaxID=3988 RepID=UPI00201AE1C0|nr:probable F-box protein At3g61730 isoform X1 [Ricinus communis]
MGKRLRKVRSICSCKSPRQSYRASPCSSLSCYDNDVWTEIAKFLDGKSLVKLAATSRWFHSVIMHDSVWKFACLRDLQIPDPGHAAFKWTKLYASVVDGSHSYTFRENEKHLDWMRIGAFYFDSDVALLTERLSLLVKNRQRDATEKLLESCGASVLSNIKKGIWISDLQLVRCPVCELEKCDGTMQTLDARHIELFQHEGFQNGSWEYELIGSHKIEKPMDAASGGIFDLKHLNDRATAGIFNLKLWTGEPDDFQPKAMITFHSVAINTNLQVNEVQYDEGFSNELMDDLQLTWYSPACEECEQEGGMCGFKTNNSEDVGCFYSSKTGQSTGALQILRVICLSVAVPSIILAGGIVAVALLIDRVPRRNRRTTNQNSATVAVSPLPNIAMVGLDESTIESYEKVVLGESMRLPAGRNDSTCAICLAEYRSKETLRCIPECKHCFHVECIDEWLKMNSSCPVCRNSPSPLHDRSQNV